MSQTWFVDSKTGKNITGMKMKKRTDALARGLESCLGLGRSYISSLDSHREHGIPDVVGIVCPNSLDFGTVIWASHKLGCTVASMSAGGTVEELQHQISLSGARTIFAHSGALERVLHAAQPCGIDKSRILVISDDEETSLEDSKDIGFCSDRTWTLPLNPIAFLCFSSGTTGVPKAVVVPHSAIIANIRQLKKSAVPYSRAASGDLALGVIPFAHMFGLVTLVHLSPHLGIATVAFRSMPSFDILLQSIVRLRITHLYLAPSLVNAFVKHSATPSYDLTFLKTAMIAAAPLDGGIESAFQTLGGPGFLVTQGFGMTECCGLVTGLPIGSPPRPGSVGQLLSLTEAKIIDEGGTTLGSGQRGQLCVRGPQICPGYLGNVAATQEAFDAEGFLLTGDIAELTADGYIFIVDRLKYMIKNKGYQVSPAELEAYLLSLESVDDAGVVGRPDVRCGEVPVAFVVLSRMGESQASNDENYVKHMIMRSVEEVKSDFKWLHDVYFVQSIPRLPSGKIMAKTLKEMADSMYSSRP
ncbi:hypothetical protein FB451DRAFT_1058531 [Mycena latifolia]|nr:hypothetical protein FB451DRAFT_1058531 [Mycena latifolia]